MKNGIVAGVDLVASVNVARDKKTIATHADKVALMSRSVCSQHGGTVDVIVVVSASCNVIGRDKQAVKILLGGDYWADIVKVCKNRIPHTIGVGLVEVLDNALLDDIDRVIWDAVKVATHSTDNCWSDASHLVTLVRPLQHFALSVARLLSRIGATLPGFETVESRAQQKQLSARFCPHE